MFRATICAALAWCTFVICMVLVCLVRPLGVTAVGSSVGLGPEHVATVLVTAIASVCTLLGVIVTAVLQIALAKQSRDIKKTARKIDDAVNNRHHIGEDGTKLGIFDVVIQTAEDIKEARRLASENRELILTVQEEQDRVKTELLKFREDHG